MSAKKKVTSIIRSSATEYRTYVAATDDSNESLEIRYENENIWLTQKMMATLYGALKSQLSMSISERFTMTQSSPRRQLLGNSE